jgi:hypothetical protein
MTPDQKQALKILTILGALPQGDGVSWYRDNNSLMPWTVAHRGTRFHGETLIDALGQLTTYLEMTSCG